MNIKRIIHLGIMAKAMEPVKKLYQDTLGLPLGHEELYEGTVDISFLPVGDSSVEIFADNPVTGTGDVTQEIEELGGEGIHHVAFEVDDLDGALDELKAKNVPIREGDPRPGAHDTRIAFLDISATHGVLIELVECAA
ncbi:MAG: VOC family protein [Deltaproteobacteria bacterium]|nr:VOC family protein [Deltaproteobacteria bacterium]